jgi:CRP/FNR family transcriptional regulator, nitrogen oxide reductase regulator
MIDLEILRRMAIFSSLTNDELVELSRIAIGRSLMPGKFVFREEDSPQYFYVIKEGRIKSIISSSLGKELMVAFLGPGEIINPVSVFQEKCSAIGSMQAVTHTKILGFKKNEFVSFVHLNSKLSFEIIKILAERMTELCYRLRDLAGERVEQRIARILLMLSSRFGPTLIFTRQEIAEMVGTTTETAIRVLSQLKKKGIVDSLRGKIIIRDAAMLRLFIEEV